MLSKKATQAVAANNLEVAFAKPITQGKVKGTNVGKNIGLRVIEETGSMVIRPPSRVMPPKRLLGFHSQNVAHPLDVAGWYYEQSMKHTWEKRSLEEEVREVAEIERECGLQCTYTSRALALGKIQSNSCDVMSYETMGSGQHAVRVRGAHGEPSFNNEHQYATCIINKHNVPHNVLVHWLSTKLNIHHNMIGLRVIEESMGHTTQTAFFKLKHSDTFSQLTRILGVTSLHNGSVHISSLSTTASPSIPGKDLAIWAAMHSIQAPQQMFFKSLQDFESSRKYINFFPPSTFGVPVHRHIPIWCVGWHLYRFDDLHVVLSIVAQGAKEHPMCRDLLQVPLEKWKGSKEVKSLLRRLAASPGKNQELRFVVNSLFEGKLRGITRGLCAQHKEWAGRALEAFQKLLWNMLVSGRMDDNKGSMLGDTVVTEKGDLQINHDELPINNVVLPLSGIFTSSTSIVWPQHRFSRKTANNLLAAFGLTPLDIDRLHHVLPTEFLATPYRRVVGTVDKIEFQVHQTPIELSPDVGPVHAADNQLLQKRIRTLNADRKKGECEAAVFMTTHLDGGGYSALREVALLKIV